MIEKPLLSICIPTFNRADYLEKCLEAIVNQDGFDEIEVVISDNCSSDGTQKLGEKYSLTYSNVKYFRNEENVVDMNFPLVFQRANGVLRKMTNDTILYKPGAIRYMLNAVRDNIEEKPQIYFLNKEDTLIAPKHYISLEKYLEDIGYRLTWIGSVAIWEEDANDLGSFMSNTDSRVAQVPYLLEHFEKHNGAVVYPKLIMGSISPKNKNLKYGLYQVFFVNFLGFIKPYLNQGKISADCYEKVQKDLLMDFFCQWIVNWEKYKDQYQFSDSENLKKLVENEYEDEPYYGEYKRRLIKLRISADIHKIVSRFRNGKEKH